ncbi:CocE/NonD family hydrolase [Arthrobacter sp.]|uniref:CocE/NonD family hydrolase n=1 Tax=Arthrobacter sp. TaxID=1667 RepID=UPI00281179CA|nr:CocE/NonD family hydrolase [Arthrobacter sp.]
MTLTSHILQRKLELPPPLSRDLVIQKQLRVPMPDGVDLLADRWAPRKGGEGLPTALVRTPYGRAGIFGTVMARPLAERGFQVLIQSTRGGYGSGGTMDPMRQERADGLATLDWVIKQPWFGDSMVLVGQSYLGFVQWAVADQLPPQVKAMIPQVTESALTLEFLREDGMSLELPFEWGVMTAVQERPWAMLRTKNQAKKTARALQTLPLNQADVAAIGHSSKYIQDVLRYDAKHEFWAAADHTHRVANVGVPVSSIGGWYDIFLPGQLRDFQVLQEEGLPARLTVGPWTHNAFHNTGVLEAVEFGLAYAKGEQPPHRPPVRLFVMGEDSWRDFDSWPPKGYAPKKFHLQPDGGLSGGPSAASEPDRYRYDPSDPTPAAGGISINHGGRVDNTALEARQDVLTYTTAPLDEDVEIIGEVSAEIWFRSSLANADVFVRLCDVGPDGRSHNICDGLTSLSAADELAAVTVKLWPTAYLFKQGHRIRVQVSSGAFPRYARNPGTGEPRATATTLRPADQTVYHDPQHPSVVTLPVRA